MIKKARRHLRGSTLVLCCFLLAVGAGAWYTAKVLLDQKTEALTEELKQYQAEVLSSEAEMVSTHLVEWVMRGRELAKARIFRSAITNFESMKEQNKKQAQEDFENFVGTAGFMAGHLFSTGGRLLATSTGKLDDTEGAYYASIQEVVKTRIPFFSPLYSYRGGLVADLYVPVYPAGALSDSVAPDHVLVLVIPLRNTLRAFLASEHGLRYATKVHLVQMVTDAMQGDSFEEIVLAYPDTMKLQRVNASLKDVKKVQFGPRMDLQGDIPVFSSVMALPAIRWWLAVETERGQLAVALQEHKVASLVALVLGGLVAILFTCAVAFFISRRRHHGNSVELREELAPLRREHDLLGRIADALPTPVCLRGADDGKILYANEAFALLCGKPRAVVPGLCLAELFNPGEVESLVHGDQMLAMSDAVYSQEIPLYRGAQPMYHHVQGVKLTLEAEREGILLVFRDTTEERQTNILNIEMRQQIIDALVRAVESVPFLDGHTSLLRQLSVDIAETLLLSDADCATVEAAAILSQVGKTFVPKEIMEKEGKLTPEEIRGDPAVRRAHVPHHRGHRVSPAHHPGRLADSGTSGRVRLSQGPAS